VLAVDGTLETTWSDNLVESDAGVTDLDLYVIGKNREWKPSDKPSQLTLMDPGGNRMRTWHDDYDFLIEANPMKHGDDSLGRSYGDPEDRPPTFPISNCVFEMSIDGQVKFRLDYIRVNPEKFSSLSGFIAFNFDISICMNLFDGQNLKIKHLDDLLERKFTARLPPKLDYHNIFTQYDDKREKKAVGVVVNSLGVADRRVKKYEQRGFMLSKRETFQERVQSIDKEYKQLEAKIEQLRQTMQSIFFMKGEATGLNIKQLQLIEITRISAGELNHEQLITLKVIKDKMDELVDKREQYGKLLANLSHPLS